MRNKFEEQLELLNEQMIKMGSLCESAIAAAAKALEDHDIAVAKNTVLLAGEIDQHEREIETMCLRLLLQQQPVARDLRQISAALKMVTDLERIGNQAAEICDIVLVMNEHTVAQRSTHMAEMAKNTIHMVTESVSAYVERDLDRAQAVIEYDDVVDDLFQKVKHEMIAAIAADPTIGEEAVDAIMIAKYFERIGDHAAIMATWVKFSLTGVHESV